MGVPGQRWGTAAAAPAAHLSLQGTRLWGLSCGGLGEFCQKASFIASGPGPGTLGSQSSPSAKWGGVPPHDVRTERHRKYKVLGKNGYLGHPPENPAISKPGGERALYVRQLSHL